MQTKEVVLMHVQMMFPQISIKPIETYYNELSEQVKCHILKINAKNLNRIATNFGS